MLIPLGEVHRAGRRDPDRRAGLRDLQERGPQHAGRRVADRPRASTPPTWPAAPWPGSTPAARSSRAERRVDVSVSHRAGRHQGRRSTTVIDALRDEPAYAVDTEFHREHTYFPKLALVQIAWRDGLALIDPLAVDIAAARRDPRRARAWPCCTRPTRTSRCSTWPAAPARPRCSTPRSRPASSACRCRRWPASTRRSSASRSARATGSPTGWPARSTTASSPTPPATSSTCSTSTTSSSPT